MEVDMSGGISGKVNETRVMFEQRGAQLKEGLLTKKEELLGRGRKLRADIDRKRERTLAKFKDESLTRLYDVSETALRSAANLVDRAQQLSPNRLAKLNDGAKALRGRAEQLEEKKGGLQKPAIQAYDDLNAVDTKDALAKLSPYQLEKIQAYESANKNRVTVLREIERLLTN